MRVRQSKAVTGVAAAIGATVMAVALTGCGTSLITNNFSLSVVEPSGRAPESVQVSIFDSAMGQSAEWAAKSIGTATPNSPYTTSFTSTATKFAGDNSPSKRIVAGIALPQIVPQGYFALTITPVDGATTTINAPFIGYYDNNATKDGTPEPLPLEVTSNASDQTWTLTIKATVPGTSSVLAGP